MITGIVLAGGGSRRFGSDKLAAELDGRTLLAGTIAAVATVADRVVVAGDRLPARFSAGDVPVALLPDPVASGGPLVALANVLSAEAAAHPASSLAIVVGGDMPRVVPDVLAALLDRLAAEPASEAIVLEAPEAPRRQVLPVALHVDAAARAAAAMIGRNERSLTGLLQRLRTIELPAVSWRALDPGGDSLADVDTPEDLERLLAEPVESPAPNGAPRP